VGYPGTLGWSGPGICAVGTWEQEHIRRRLRLRLSAIVALFDLLQSLQTRGSHLREDEGEAGDVGTLRVIVAIKDFQYTGVQPNFGALMAFGHVTGSVLVEFETGTLQPGLKDEHMW